MRADTITLAVFEKYEAEELATIAKELSGAIADVETIAGEKKASDAVFNGRIKECEEKISDLAKRYNKGGETAQIGCDIRYDNPEPGKKSYYRMDRAELVETHDMSWDEKQETIQFPLATAPEPTAEQLANPLGEIEEVTRLCEKTPGCSLFAEHDGGCVVEKPEDNAENSAGDAA